MKRLLLLLVAIAGIHWFAEKQTQGFRFYKLLSNLPFDSRWETPQMESERLDQINARLNQSFTFLGAGGWCVAFLGEDQKTVLKFFRHIHLDLPNIFRRFSFQKLLLNAPPEESKLYYFQHFNFNSCHLLFTRCKELSGIDYLHLNKTPPLHPTVTLYDPSGVPHQIDLNATEFVIQERADLLCPHINRLVKEEGMPAAKKAIDAFLHCLLTFYKEGLRDDDRTLRDNFGFIGDQPVTVDLSSWVLDPAIQKPSRYKKEIILKTHRLNRWLNKYHPELHQHLEERLCDILDETFI